jgi:LacI family transcriptional regulator
MASIKDVAKLSGVSATTVSAVVNNAEWVPESTKLRVQDAIKTLGYRRNLLARGLKRQEHDSIGLIVSNIASPYQTEIVRKLTHTLFQYDRSLLLCDSDYDYTLGEKNLIMLLEKQVAGIILLGDAVSKEALESVLRYDAPLPIVAIERDYDLPNVNTLLVNSEQAAYRATTHLIEKGRQRIAIIAGPTTGPGSNTFGRVTRFQGYQRALKNAGIPFDPALVVEGNFRLESGQNATKQLLELNPIPDAIFAINDLMAIGALRTLRRAGLRVPEDIAIVGYDDSPLASLVFPTLSTMAIPQQEIAQVAADILEKQIQQRQTPNLETDSSPRKWVFSAELVVRESS